MVSRTEEVYDYVRRHGAGRVFACKGASHETHTPVRATNIDRMPSSRVRIPGGLWLYLLDTHYFKSLIFARLEPDAHQPITLHNATTEAFAAQIAAEALVRDRNGKLAWVKKSKNNHLLDCTMMAHACVDGAWLPSLQMLIERELQARAETRQTTRPQHEALAERTTRTELPMRTLPTRELPARELPGRAAHPTSDQTARPRFMRGRGDF